MRKNRSIAVLFIVLAAAVAAAGCATSGAADSVSASIPTGPSSISGTWYGTGMEMGRDGGWPYRANYILTVNDDWTATMTGRLDMGPAGSRAAFKYTLTATVQGDRVILSETNGSHWVSLKRTDRALYGVLEMSSWRAGVRGPVAMEFHRSEARP